MRFVFTFAFVKSATLSILILISLLIISGQVYAQTDSVDYVSITKQLYNIGAIEVPMGKQWEVEKITVSAGTYPVLANSILPDAILKEGEKFSVPMEVAEAHLLSEGEGSYLYTIYIKEYSTTSNPK